jgi:hypothetical protein
MCQKMEIIFNFKANFGLIKKIVCKKANHNFMSLFLKKQICPSVEKILNKKLRLIVG